MRCRPGIAVGFVLCAVILPVQAAGAWQTSAGRAPTAEARPKAPTPPAKTPAATRKPPQLVPGKPAKLAAELPAASGAASVTRGCLAGRDLLLFASRVGVAEAKLSTLFAEADVPVSEDSACIPYIVATGGANGAASAVFLRDSGTLTEDRLLMLRKTGDLVTLTPSACLCGERVRRELTIPVQDQNALPTGLLAELPDDVRWEISVMGPHMIGALEPETTAPDGQPVAPTEAESSARPGMANRAAGAHALRVVLERETSGGPEHLLALELVESATGRAVDGAWWLERPEGPGVLAGGRHVDYERLLWQMPVNYVRMSRGVGTSVVTVRRRVPAPKGSAQKTVLRTVRVPVQHIGVDFAAPRGTPVHAVSEAKVAFVGTRSGYGKLVILDHGGGYQTYYAHLSVIPASIRPGTGVSRGQEIGRVGSTGKSTGAHLHFEIRKDSKFIDPFDVQRELDRSVLTAADQERLLMQVLRLDQTPGPSGLTFAPLCPEQPVVAGPRR